MRHRPALQEERFTRRLHINISLNVGELAQSITVEGSVSMAAELAPIQSTLEARSAKSEISPEYIQNYASPVADFSELLNNAPGTFSVNPNGVGLGDSKTSFRGFSDGQYTMLADGIPFNDTNSPTHHSWAFFPSQFIAGVDFDRSPGSASAVGPTNFGGSINLLSRSVALQPDIRVTASYGSFNTRMLALDADSGQFGKGKKFARPSTSTRCSRTGIRPTTTRSASRDSSSINTG